jgi:MFS transporter, DHA1 family, multidrug resistance protein
MMSALLNQKTKAKAGASVPVSPGWYVLAVLSLLMGFASISTDLYLPAMPAISRSLHAGAGMIEYTMSGYLIGFSLGQLLWGRSATVMAAVYPWPSVWSCS